MELLVGVCVVAVLTAWAALEFAFHLSRGMAVAGALMFSGVAYGAWGVYLLQEIHGRGWGGLVVMFVWGIGALTFVPGLLLAAGIALYRRRSKNSAEKTPAPSERREL